MVFLENIVLFIKSLTRAKSHFLLEEPTPGMKRYLLLFYIHFHLKDGGSRTGSGETARPYYVTDSNKKQRLWGGGCWVDNSDIKST